MTDNSHMSCLLFLSILVYPMAMLPGLGAKYYASLLEVLDALPSCGNGNRTAVETKTLTSIGTTLTRGYLGR